MHRTAIALSVVIAFVASSAAAAPGNPGAKPQLRDNAVSGTAGKNAVPSDPGPKPLPISNRSGTSINANESSFVPVRLTRIGIDRTNKKANAVFEICDVIAKSSLQEKIDPRGDCTTILAQRPAKPSFGKLRQAVAPSIDLCNWPLIPRVTKIVRAEAANRSTATGTQGGNDDLDLLLVEVRDSDTKLEEACARGHERSAVASLEGIALTAVGGLSDFLVARAKDEATLYGIEQFGNHLCKGQTARILFKESCAAVALEKPERNGDSIEIDTEAVTSGRFLAAFSRDLRRLPESVVDLAKLPEDDRLYLKAVVTALAELPRGLSASDVPRTAVLYLRAHRAAGAVCDVDHLTHSCGAALALEAADVAFGLSAAGGISVEDWLDQTATNFCKDFAGETDDSGKCIFASSNYSTLKEQSDVWLAAYRRILDAEHAFDALASNGNVTSENLQKSLFSLSNALAATMEAVTSAVQCSRTFPDCGAGGQVPEGVKNAVLLLADTAEFVGAVMRKDVPEVLRGTRSLLLVADAKIPVRVLHAIDFGVALSMAKDRNEEKEVTESAADPVGGYKLKYGLESGARVTLNGFVGFFAGYEHKLNLHTTPADEDSLRGRGAYRLSAPVGLDFTPSALSWTNYNIGLGTVFLDPLALARVDSKGETPKPRVETVFAFGGYLRLGLWRSPVNLMVMATYQPWLRTDDKCVDGERCWSGAWQVGGALGVDVPIFTLK